MTEKENVASNEKGRKYWILRPKKPNWKISYISSRHHHAVAGINGDRLSVEGLNKLIQ